MISLGLVTVLLAFAAITLGLRTTSLYVSDRMHPVARLLLAVFTGGLMTALILQACSSYRVLELGMGLLFSLAPVGVYDLARWWFRSQRRK